MEDELGFNNPEKVEHIFLTQEFNKYCPFFISIGMTYEQFWEGDPTMTRDYLVAYKENQKRESERLKWIMWEQGLYIYEAICDVSPILRAFSKATKPLPYPKEPWGLNKIQNQDDEELQKLKAERDKYRTQIFFQNWVDAQKKRFNNK